MDNDTNTNVPASDATTPEEKTPETTPEATTPEAPASTESNG